MREGWTKVRLRDVCTLLNGRAYKKKELLQSGRYPVLRVGNFFSNRDWYYSDLELEDNKYCDNGDLLYAWSASFGPKIWDGGKVIFHYHIWKTVLDEKRVEKRFLYYWFDWDAEKIKSEQGAGTTMIHVTKGSMENRPLYLPPLREQKRIVAILDEAFEGIATATNNAESNLANARELFESEFNSFLVQGCAGEPSSVLAKLCEPRTITYGVIKLGKHQSNGVPCLRTSNVRKLWIDTNGMKLIDPALSQQYGRTILHGGEVLVNVRGTLGGVAVARSDMRGWNVSREVAVVPVDQNKINPEFAAYWIASKHSKNWLTGVLKGVAYTGINLTDLRELPISIPSLDKQNDMVERLRRLQDQCEGLAKIYEQEISSLRELKQSLLQKAFAGELTRGATAAIKEEAYA